MSEQYDSVRSFLVAVRRRWFAQELLSAASRAAAAAAVPAVLALTVYWFLQPAGLLLVLLASLAIVTSTIGALLMVLRMHRRPSERQVARFVEERAAAAPNGVAFEDTLVTAVDSRAAADPAFGPLLVAATVERLHRLTPADIVPADRIRRAGLQAAGALLGLGATLALTGAPLRRAVDTAQLLFFPETIEVQVLPGNSRIVAGRPLQIRAIVRAGDRVLSHVTPSLTVSSNDARRSVPMAADGNAFAVPFESVDRTFRYKVTAGSASSPEFTITALFPPRIERIELSYTYPAFTGLEPRTDEDGGDIYAPEGTRVRIRVHADKTIASGRMSFEDGGSKALNGRGGEVVEAELVLARDDAYRLELADTDGLTTNGTTEYFIRLMDDRPPDVRIIRPAGDQRITPLEEVAIEARADDDHGISSFDLVYAVAGGESRVVPFANLTANGSARIGAHILAAEELGVKAGDVITYYARARDVGRGKRPTEARSDMYFLEVRPFGEEFVAARSQAGGGGAASARIESLIAAQKEIIAATWNVERRSGAGKSSRDVAAIALAQAELKTRAEQLGSTRSRGGVEIPQQILPGPSQALPPGEGVGGAITAMGRAVELLQRENTKEALGHEMAALQALLKIQAEVRRREVAMQQGAGSGGDQAREDLSALFDKELQRQQGTRYETRPSLQERPDAKAESALDRIRDLARRQEELGRRQRDLAEANLDAEERTRQLERLTREQEELRRQLEEVAKGRNEATQQNTGASPQGAAQANPLRDASEQMRDAAGALERADVTRAAERSERAAEQLRRAEQAMQGDAHQTGERAAGELRLEAQQIADEQRRIASEASRLDKADSAASADARRRLAGEKEQLADRVDNLERVANALSKTPPSGGEGEGEDADATSRIRKAAGELTEQEIGQQMRETAARMRGDAPGALAGAEEQLARTLDSVAEQLGGASAGTRQLASLLDRTRAIRDRLDSLERQIAEAEARAQQRGEGQADVDQLRQEYARELQQARGSLERLQRRAAQSGAGGGSPEEHEWSQADPGTERYKQDFSGWQELRKDINLALERTEAAVSARLAREATQDRLSAGGSDRVPHAYERLIARYYESLARRKK